MRAREQAHFRCVLSEAVPVGDVSWYLNGVAVQPDDADWTVTADGCQHGLLLCSAQLHHAGEVTFAAREAVATARLSVLGKVVPLWWVGRSGLQVQPWATLIGPTWSCLGSLTRGCGDLG